MLTYFQAIIMGAIQGMTELFPVSSLGHSVILPRILGWTIDQHGNFFLIFLVATHLATAIVLFGFFYKDWVLIVKGIVRSLKARNIDPLDTYAKLGWLIVVSSIPAGILGLLFEENLKTLFASPKSVAIFLILNGLMLYGAELLNRKHENASMAHEKLSADHDTHNDDVIAKISWVQSVKVGLAQCLALIPGFSRTGSTIGGGMLIGLNRDNAARFSFLLAAPIILAASILKLPELATSSDSSFIGPILTGSIAAGIMAYFSVRFLSKYFETKKLTPFAIYCVIAGIIASLVFLVR